MPEAHGEWECVSATIDGQPLADEAVAEMRLQVTKDRFRTSRSGMTMFDGAYRLDRAGDPPHIDIVAEDGPMAGKAAQGIIRVDGDMLMLCYSMPGKERPLDFDSPKSSDAYFLIWRRLEEES